MLFNYDKNSGEFNFGGIIPNVINSFRTFEISEGLSKQVDRDDKLFRTGQSIDDIIGQFSNEKENKTTGLSDKEIKMVDQYHKHLKKIGKTIEELPFEDFVTNVKGMSTQGSKASGVLKNLGKSALSFGANLLSGLASAAISWGINKLIEKSQEASEALKKTRENAASFVNTMEEFRESSANGAKTAAELEDRYQHLVQGVDEMGHNISLTDEQYNEYLEIVKQLSEIMPNLTTYFNEQGEAIGFVGGKLSSTTEEYKKYQQEQAKQIVENGNEDGASLDDAIATFNEDKWSPSTKEPSAQKKIKLIDELLKSDNPEELHGKLVDFSRSTNKSDLYAAEYVADAEVKLYDGERYLYSNKYEKDLDQLTDSEFNEFINDLQVKKNKYQLQMDNEATNLKLAITTYAQTVDEYWDLDEDQLGALNTVIQSLSTDFLYSALNPDEKLTRQDVENLVGNIIDASGTKGFTEALNNLFAPDLNKDTWNEYFEAIQSDFEKVTDALGFDEKQKKEFAISLGLEYDTSNKGLVEDNELVGIASKKTGLSENKIKELFSVGEVQLIANVDFIPTRKYTDKDADGLKEELGDFSENVAYNKDISKTGEDVKSKFNNFTKYAKEYAKISKVVNGEMYLTQEEMAELVDTLPELSKHLKLTQKGWTLESGAMDSVQTSVKELQVAYIEAQTMMASEGAQMAMLRMQTNAQELANIQSIAQAYAFLSDKGVRIAVTTDGGVDTSLMSQEDIAAYNTVITGYRLGKMQNAIKESSKLGSEKASNDKSKQRKKIHEEQATSDFKHALDELNQTLEEYTKKLEALKSAQDNLFENDYIGKLDYINQRYTVQSEFTSKTKEELDNLLATVPPTAQGWNDLASSVENTFSKYIEGKKALTEYQVELSQTYMDALKYSNELSKTVIDESVDNFSKNVKKLTEGGLGGLKFSLSPIVPQDAVAKQRKENKELAKEEEAYQEKVNEIKQRALDEMKAYEDQQRAEQLAEIESESMALIDTLSADFESAFKTSWDEIKAYCEANGIDWGKFLPSDITNESDFSLKKDYAKKLGIEVLEGEAAEEARSKNDNLKGTGAVYKVGGKYFESIEGAKTYAARNVKNSSSADVKRATAQLVGATITTESDGSWAYNLAGEQYRTIEGLRGAINEATSEGSPQALIDAYCKLYGVEIDKSDSKDWKYKYNNKSYDTLDEVKKEVTEVRSKATGGTATGDIIVNEEGQESYLGKDGKLHLFKPGAQFFNTDEVIRVFNAEDTKKIRKYTGDKYFNEPVGDLSKVTQLANGNIHAIFPTISPENANDATSNDTIGETTEKATEEHYDRLSNIQNKALDEEISMDAEAQAITEAQKEQHYDNLELAQQTTNDITSQEQIADNAEKVTEEKRFSAKTEGVITELLNWMKENPIKAPGLDTASWEQMISDAQGYMSRMMGGFGTGVRGEINGDMPYYNQGDYSAYTYGGKPMNTNACAPTSMAMVLSYLGKNVNPVEAAKYSEKNGFYTSGQGTSWGLFDSMAKAYGVNCDTIGSSSSAIISSLKAGRPVIVSVNGGTFNPSGRGHLFVLAGIDDNGKIIVNDPGSRERTSKTWDISAITSNARNAWSFYATGTKDYGVAGENYKKEYLIDKKTGQWTEVNSPTLIDTNEVDVVGEKASALIDKPIPMFANGTPTTDEKLLSMVKTVCEKYDIPPNIFLSLIDQETGSSWYDSVKDSNGSLSYGYTMLNDGGVLAELRTRGQSDLAEKAKTDKYTNLDVAGMFLKEFYEATGSWEGALGKYNGSGAGGRYVSQVMNRAQTSLFINAANNLDSIASYTQETATAVKEVRRSFEQQFRDFIDGSNAISNSESVEDSLMNFIKSNTEISSDSTEKFIEAFEGLNTYKDSMEPYFEGKREEVRNAAGTPEFAGLTNAYNKEHSEYIETIMGYSTDMTVAQAKAQYKLSEDAIKAGYKYYNERKNAGASATELMEIATKLSEIEKVAEEYSDAYVQAISAETDFLVSRTERTLNAFDNEMSWLDKDLEKAEGDTAKQAEIYSQKNDVSKRAMDAAHQKVLDIRQDEDYADILSTYDVESWFDANGELTSKFYEDVEGASSELIPYMNQFAEIVGTCKKDWYENAEAIESNNEAMADLKIEEYIKYQERLVEALDFDATLSQSLSTAKEGMYNIFKTLRDERAEMEKELKANMQIDDWLTEDTRKLLFNLDDYEEQMETINGIQAEAEKLYINYQNELAGLKEDELYKEEEITAEYNRQLEKLQDRLSIAKADLQLAKDKAAFENALRERDTQIIMGNRVQNVADPERLRDAAMKMAESESALGNEVTTSNENQDIRNMEAATGMINQEKAAIQNRIDMINGMTEAERRALADFIEPIEIINTKLTAISKVNPEKIIRGDNSDDVVSSLDLSKRDGWSLTEDHSGMVEMIQNLIDNGYYKKGTPEYDLALQLQEWIKWQHDNKTTSDAHNYGYSLYDADNAYLWGKGAMKMFSDDVFRVMSQHWAPIEEYISSLASPLVDSIKENSKVIEHNGQKLIATTDENGNTTLTNISFLEGYEELSGADMIKNTLGYDDDKANAIYQALVSGVIVPSMDMYKDLTKMGVMWNIASGTTGNTDNSINMQEAHFHITEPVQDANGVMTHFVRQLEMERSTTNNQR